MFGAVLHRGVPIIRNAQWQLYQPDLSFNVDIIAAAGIDLRTRYATTHLTLLRSLF
jgi:hypothetical protein